MWLGTGEEETGQLHRWSSTWRERAWLSIRLWGIEKKKVNARRTGHGIVAKVEVLQRCQAQKARRKPGEGWRVL